MTLVMQIVGAAQCGLAVLVVVAALGGAIYFASLRNRA